MFIIIIYSKELSQQLMHMAKIRENDGDLDKNEDILNEITTKVFLI